MAGSSVGETGTENPVSGGLRFPSPPPRLESAQRKSLRPFSIFVDVDAASSKQ